MSSDSADERIVHARISYERGALEESSLAPSPHEQFARWFEEALESGSIAEPNAMVLSTVNADARPSARIVLLRGYDERGFVFFTNYESEKGRDLAENPHCALLLYWGPLERQIRIEGTAFKLDPEESDVYFARRPRGHRLGAWASPQSRVIPSRAYLDDRMAAEERRFADREVDRPPFWGGYRVVPVRFEFWQGRPNRVHDRIVYRREAGPWRTERLAP
jgi:pyridoxamine 5'-phosphate oxidase